MTLIGTGFLCVNPLFSCSLEIESLFQFFLNCHFLINICETLLEELAKIDLNILNLCYDSIVEVLLYASSKYDMNQNSYTLNATVKICLKIREVSWFTFVKIFCYKIEPP